jgi:uncharacterized delta-60 repeat protein
MRARNWTLAAAAALTLCAAAPAALAAPGDLDPSFGSGGKKTLDFGGDEGALALRLQPDGKLVLSGYYGALFAGFRLTDNGSADPAFSGDGLATLGFGGIIARARALALQGDGKIVLAGQTLPAGGGDDIALGRLNADGTADGSFFDATGRRTLNLFGADGAAAVLVQPNGSIVVAGHGGSNTNMIQARFTSDGGIDGSYGGGFGNTGQDFFGGSDVGFGATLLPDGRIVTVGSTSNQSNALISRVNPDGTPDKTLEGDGVHDEDIGGADVAEAVALQPDGKMVLTGTGGPGADLFVLRLSAGEGLADPSFGQSGDVTFDFGGADYGRAIAIQANGKIVVAGSTGRGDMVVVRLQPNGALDTTFGTGGKRTIDFGGTDTAYGVGLQADGKIAVAGVTYRPGATGEDLAIARLDGDEPSAGGGPGGGGPGGKAKAFRCHGKRATIIGTSRKDRLRGTKRADVIVALGGGDTVDGKGGNDLICAGDGKDRVKGGDGNDRVYGGNGNDTVSGGNGNDRIAGESAKDKLSGGPGNDSLDGGSGNDKLYGQGGKDTLLGRAGKDALAGGPGTDKQKQ